MAKQSPATPLPLYTVIRNNSQGWPALVECTGCGKRFKRERGWQVGQLAATLENHACPNALVSW